MVQPLQGSTEPSRVDVTYNGQRREYLAVWLEGPRASTTKTLRGQRVSAVGAPVGAPLTLGEEPVSAFSPPSVAANERTGSYAVAIESLDQTVGVRVFDGEGGVLSEGAVSQARSNGCGFPDVAYRSRLDEYLIGFACGLPAEAGQPPQTQYVQRLSATGVEIGPDVPVITPRYTNFGNGELALAYNARLDQFLFVGQGRRRIRTRRLDGSGTPIGSVKTLRRVNVGSEVSSPVVGFDPRTMRYLVAWSGDEPRGRDSSANAVFSTRVGERGVERGPEALRRGAFTSSIVARGNAGGFLVGLSDEPRTLVRFLSR